MGQGDSRPDDAPPSWSGGGMDDPGMAIGERVARLGEALLAHGQRLAVAESCTGGLLAAHLTEQSGSSNWFECGWVTYSNAAKQRDLGVPGVLFSEVGAVSGEVVCAMAEGAIRRADASYAVAISGVAGPSGGSDAKPVGTVWIGWAHRSPRRGNGAPPDPVTTYAARFRFDGDRVAVRQAAVDAALRGLCAHLAGEHWDDASAARWSSAFWPSAGLKMQASRQDGAGRDSP